MLNKNNIPAQVYKLNRERNGNHYLTFLYPRFNTPEKHYGRIDADVDIIWKEYNRALGGTGVMLTGDTGSGKSLLGDVLSNVAIANGLPVIYCTEIRTDISTINYLAMMKNAVIYFDEFGKNFDNRLQDKMLSMLASVSGGKKLFIITESIINRINSDILNRTKRIKYHLDYGRIDKEVLIEYCNDYNVDNKFFKELYAKYETSPKFSFDNLEGIVSEHQTRPEADLDELLRMLNLSALTRPLHVGIKGVKDLKTELSLKYTFTDGEVKLNDFKSGRRIWIDIKLPVEKPKEETKTPETGFGFRGGAIEPSENIMLTNDMISKVDGTLYTLKYGDKYEIYIEGQ